MYQKDAPKTLGGVDFTTHALSSGQEMAKLNTVKLSKLFFSSLNFHIHIFNMSFTTMQSIKWIHGRL